MKLSTFSITARCPQTGRVGVAVATASMAVGALCPVVVPEIGAAATQAWVNPLLAETAVRYLADGRDAETALELALKKDSDCQYRQLAVVPVSGAPAAWTGGKCDPFAGQHLGEEWVVLGNMLKGIQVLDAVHACFAAGADMELSQRLLRALEAGVQAGGDRRGLESAALIVADGPEFPYVDLRVDWHEQPVAELRRLYNLWNKRVLRHYSALQSRFSDYRAAEC